MYPGLAVAEELLSSRPGTGIVFACSCRPIDRRVLEPWPYAIVPQPVRPLPHRPGEPWPFLWGWIRSKVQAREMVGDLKPIAVLGLGGFAAAPLVRAAAAAGIRTALLNPDAVPGKANRYLARRAGVIFTQFNRTRQSFPRRLRDRVRCVGCPVRASFPGADRAEAVRWFDLRADRKTLLVLGGSQGAASVNAAFTAVIPALADLADLWQVLHVTGAGMSEAAPARRGPWPVHVRTLEYCRRMDLAYAAADLVLGRGGAVTVAEAAVTGTPAIIMPYPYHRDRQQHLNAEVLARAGAAIVCDDAADRSANAGRLRRTLLPLLTSPSRLGAMRAALCRLARPHAAAAAVAEWLLGA